MYKNARIVYISGSMEGRLFKFVKKERDIAIKKITDAGFFACNPLRHKGIELGKTMNLANTKLEIQQIIGRDELDILHSDALIVLTGDTPSSGTWFEFAFAHYVVKIPIIVIAPKMRKAMDKKGAAFEWTGGKATKVVSTIDAAIAILEWLFGNRYSIPHSDLNF